MKKTLILLSVSISVLLCSSCINMPEKPSDATTEPEITTAAPTVTANEPDTSTNEPETSTKEPETSTKEPDASTKAPDTSTKAPDTSTKAPDITTEAPAVTTTAPHICNFNKAVASAEYLKDKATFVSRAVYYYSCECGEKGTETFEHGEKLEDIPVVTDGDNNNWSTVHDPK